MSPVAYYHICRDLRNPYSFRIKMVQYAQHHGISQAARAFAMTRRTVRKWLRRYAAQGTPGLSDQSRAPHHIPLKALRKWSSKPWLYEHSYLPGAAAG